MRQFKIGAQDYLSGKRKGRYGITVPKPYAFEVREKLKSKSIRERKVERMVAEKEAAEERELQNKYRAKPIPPEVVQPKYYALQQAQLDRQMQVKQES